MERRLAAILAADVVGYSRLLGAAEAVAALERGIARNPEALWPHVFLAACLGHLGEQAPARAALADGLRKAGLSA